MTVRHRPEKKTKDGRAYCFDVCYTDTLGKYKHYTSKMFKTSKEAKEQEAMFKSSLDTFKHQEDKPIKELTKEYRFIKQQNLKATSYDKLNNYLNRIDNQLGKIKASKLNANHLEEFKKYLTACGYSAKTKNQILACLSKVMEHAYAHYNIHNDILKRVERFKNIEKKKEMQFITHDEFYRFIKEEQDIRYKAFFIVLYYMGLRLSEANGLQWKHINFDERTLTVNQRAITYKGKLTITSPKTKHSYRTLPMSKPVIDILSELKLYWMNRICFSIDCFVFGGDFILSKTSISRHKDTALKQAKIDKKIRVHDFRHSCASLLVNSNANITVVSQFLGHASTKETLDIYSHMYSDKLLEVVKIINEKTATPE